MLIAGNYDSINDSNKRQDNQEVSKPHESIEHVI